MGIKMKPVESNSDIVFTDDGYRYFPDSAGIPDCEKAFFDNYKAGASTALYELAFADDTSGLNSKLLYLYSVSSEFINAVSSDYSVQLTHHAAVAVNSETLTQLLSQLPYALGAEKVTEEWFNRVWEQLGAIFDERLSSYGGTVGDYINSQKASQNVMGRVYFHLVENKSDIYPFAFLATYCNMRAGKPVQQPLSAALKEFKGKNDELLKLLPTVLRAAEKSDFISEIIESGEIFSPIGLTGNEAYRFLCEIPVYNECGILCRIPNWWKKHTRRAAVSVVAGEKAPSRVGADALMSFDVSITLDGERLDENDIKELLSAVGGLALIKGKWVEADAQRLKETLAAYESVKKSLAANEYSFAQVIRMQLGISDLDGSSAQGFDDISISQGEWLKGFLKQINSQTQHEDVPVSSGFRGSLRPYQETGYRWLRLMETLGFGACLSDDMGLGKTVQVIALLDKMREDGRGTSLLIVPASLLENWQKELTRFAPSIKYKTLHKSYGITEITRDDGTDVYITTYAMAARNEKLKEQSWEAVILDEAQAIKNPGTKQAKSVKAIPAGFKIAMTGTPVENRLTDLWSLFDFLNSGMLGNLKEFSDFSKRLRETGDYSKLKQAVGPFILRRLKTDKTIISDLPDKIEMKNYPRLTKKQVVLYKSIVQDLDERLNSLDGIERKGLVLASIIKLKQICDHPDLYAGQGAFTTADSGKYELLGQLCETVMAKRERMLVFTQFKEMCDPLDEFLSGVFGQRGLVIHGATSVKKRGGIVERFNSDDGYVPYMVLSLKAGGVGLNLTGANHVVHFDRWWNPAVENQATDRAFRIGQTKNVLVHKLITKGTVEEKIDAMIEDKKTLANDILSDAGESWITELSTDELMSLFRLEA